MTLVDRSTILELNVESYSRRNASGSKRTRLTNENSRPARRRAGGVTLEF